MDRFLGLGNRRRPIGRLFRLAGWTVKNTRDGTIGIGRAPWPDRELAQAWTDAENARLAAIAAQYVK